jgi:hypothetical protein
MRTKAGLEPDPPAIQSCHVRIVTKAVRLGEGGRCHGSLAGIGAAQDIGPIEPPSEEEITVRKFAASPLVCISMGRALAMVEVDVRVAAIRDAITRSSTTSNETSSGI